MWTSSSRPDRHVEREDIAQLHEARLIQSAQGVVPPGYPKVRVPIFSIEQVSAIRKNIRDIRDTQRIATSTALQEHVMATRAANGAAASERAR